MSVFVQLKRSSTKKTNSALHFSNSMCGISIDHNFNGEGNTQRLLTEGEMT